MTLAVLHVAQPRDAGVPRVAAALVRDQVERGWDVSVASPPDGELRVAADAAGARWLSWSATRSPAPATAAETRRLGRVLREVDPVLVHLHSAKAGLAGRLAVRGARTTVFQPHAWSFEAASAAGRAGAIAWERVGARWADVVVCVSADERRRGEDVGVSARYAEIPNGVDLRRYAPAGAADRAAARKAFGIDADVPLAVTVGRLARQKGQDVLLAAWPTVLERVPHAELVLVGDGPDRKALEARAVEGVTFAGQTSDVRDWLAAASVVVQPSRWEGMSLSLLEALAAARAVVVTDVPGMAEVVVDGVGAVVPPDDPAALRDAITARLADPALADREGARGRAHVESHYDVRVASARMAELYEQTLAARRR